METIKGICLLADKLTYRSGITYYVYRCIKSGRLDITANNSDLKGKEILYDTKSKKLKEK